MNTDSIKCLPAWAACAAATSLLVAIASAGSSNPQSFNESPIYELGQFISQNYQVRISLRFRADPACSDHTRIDANMTSPGESQTILRLLESEMTLYPRDYLRSVILKQIVICNDLTQDGKKKGAISDFTHDTLYLSCDPGGDTEASKRRDIHHEIFHMIDARDDGSFEDNTWEEMNLPTFRYGNGHGRNWVDVPGFLTGYAMMDVAEDKAEIFSYMMTAYESVQFRAKSDLVIHRKLAAMMTFIENQCPEMDASFGLRRRWLKPSDRIEMNSLGHHL